MISFAGVPLKEMRVRYGYGSRIAHEVITPLQQHDAIANWRRLVTQDNYALQHALREQGCQEGAYRGADRLLQKLRKAGVVANVNGRWEFLG